MLCRDLLAVPIGLALLTGAVLAKEPPPVIQELGPVLPTPAPSPERAQRIRMITAFTLQNRPDGDSIISFEASDLARVRSEEGKEGYKVMAVELYSLAVPKKEARVIRDRIMREIRELERDLLEYVETVGPPRERERVTGASGSQRSW